VQDDKFYGFTEEDVAVMDDGSKRECSHNGLFSNEDDDDDDDEDTLDQTVIFPETLNY
jgi:hypothetical protein